MRLPALFPALGLATLLGLSACDSGQAAVSSAPHEAQPSVVWIGAGGAPAQDPVGGSSAGPPTGEASPPPGPLALAHEPSAALERDLAALVDKGFLAAKKLRGGKLSGAETQVSVSVRDARSGAVLADVRAARSMRPASNMKLVTTAAALTLLGTGGEFETRFELAGDVSNGRLEGDLVVRAGGDPVVHDESGGAVEAFFDPLVSALQSKGIRHIAGAVLLDEGDFLEPGPGPAWPSANQRWKDYCALAAGLTLNGGVLEARVTATSPGAAARIELHPVPTGIKTKLGVMTKPGDVNDVRVGATPARVTVGGFIGAKTGVVEAAFRHPDPVGLFGAGLEERLERAGISIDGGVVRRRGPPASEPLLAITSPVLDSLVPINTYSTNGVADQLFFKLGHDFGGGGTREGGQASVERALGELGISLSGLVQVDGSGLSRENRVSPQQLTGLLFGALKGLDQGARAAELFKDSLAVMGQSGTLKTRMRGEPAAGHVFAKTGFIDGTSALSGLIERSDGRKVLFSILVNYPSVSGLNKGAWKPMQEDMVARLYGGEL